MIKSIFCNLVFGFTLFVLTSGHEGPVVGILSEELSRSLKRLYPNYTSFIAASYVKAVEGAGGRVVPVLIGQDEDYYRKQVAVINGIVLPGGACYFDTPNGYAEAGAHLYKLAIEANKNGDYFPILGVCLGFELLLHLANDKKELRISCDSQNVGLPLNFLPGFKRSRLYGKADKKVLSILASYPVTSNHHRRCITPKNMTITGLKRAWKILSTNKDSEGLTFVSSTESVKYPIAGVQFHPEKSIYEWKKSQNNPHSAKAIYSARHFYDWIVEEASKNNHSYPTDGEMYNALIENYSVFFTSKQGVSYEQVYLFE